MKRLASIGMLVFMPCASAAWTAVGQSQDGSAYFIDLEHIDQRQDGTVRVWTKWEYTKQQPISGANKFSDDPHFYLSMRGYNEYDCKERRVRALDLTLFTERDLAGQSITATADRNTPGVPHYDPGWEFAAPDTVGWLTLDAVCPKKNK